MAQYDSNIGAMQYVHMQALALTCIGTNGHSHGHDSDRRELPGLAVNVWGRKITRDFLCVEINTTIYYIFSDGSMATVSENVRDLLLWILSPENRDGLSIMSRSGPKHYNVYTNPSRT